MILTLTFQHFAQKCTLVLSKSDRVWPPQPAVAPTNSAMIFHSHPFISPWQSLFLCCAVHDLTVLSPNGWDLAKLSRLLHHFGVCTHCFAPQTWGPNLPPAEVESCATKNIPSPASVEWLQSAIAVNGGCENQVNVGAQKTGVFSRVGPTCGPVQPPFGPLLFNSDNVFDKIKLLGFNHWCSFYMCMVIHGVYIWWYNGVNQVINGAVLEVQTWYKVVSFAQMQIL